jgi:hypothetical protein
MHTSSRQRIRQYRRDDGETQAVDVSGSASKGIPPYPRSSQAENSVTFCVFLQSADVTGLRPALALGDFELDPLVFLKIPETRSLDRREVYEHVLAALVGANEPKALLTVEPLHRALCHPVCLLIMTRPALRRPKAQRERVCGLLP